MKKKRTSDNIKLGIFVTAGVVFLVFSLYMIGKNRNLFGSTFSISTRFKNINGLVRGNNVRFSGIDVGTVESVTVETDSTVLVKMVIDLELKKHIKKNAVASIGTDGIVGNRLINISAMRGNSVPVNDGDVISSRLPVETDEMLRTLQTTNTNIAAISHNLLEVSERLNGSSSLWNLLADTLMADDLHAASRYLRQAGLNTQNATAGASVLISKLSDGNGMINSVFADTSLSNSLKKSMSNIHTTSEDLKKASSGILNVTSDLKHGKGTIGLLLSDSVASIEMARSISNIEQGTKRFNENMEAMRKNFLFRKYFKKQNKK